VLVIDDISVGNIVHLNSGSPPLMIVAFDYENETINVVWMNEKDALQEWKNAPVACFKE
jgi:hypothetical protein